VELGGLTAIAVTFQSALQVFHTLDLINTSLTLLGINVDLVENLQIKDLHLHTKKFLLEMPA
jgi:predicted nucleotidyltransferase